MFSRRREARKRLDAGPRVRAGWRRFEFPAMAFFSSRAEAKPAPSAAETILARHPKPTLGERIVEHRGGIIFSVFLHLLAASIWFGRQYNKPRPATSSAAPPVSLAPPSLETRHDFPGAPRTPGGGGVGGALAGGGASVPDFPREALAQDFAEAMAALAGPQPGESGASGGEKGSGNSAEPPSNASLGTSSIPGGLSPKIPGGQRLPSENIAVAIERMTLAENVSAAEVVIAEASPENASAEGVVFLPPAEAPELLWDIDRPEADDDKRGELLLEPQRLPISDSDQRLLESAREAMLEREARLAQKVAAAAMETAYRRLESKGRELNLKNDGAKNGISRRLELRGVPEGLLERVLFKNGMEILHAHLDANFRSNSPIGSAVTDEGVYAAAPVTREGIYEVVNISPRALAKIASLEEEYIRAQRLDPNKTQLVSVTYGVANLGGNKGYDLVILQAEHRSLE
jgi:hypothetical protein